MKKKGVGKLDSFEFIPGTAARKLTNPPAVIFFYPCPGRWFIFTKQIIVLICHLQLLVEVLQNRCS